MNYDNWKLSNPVDDSYGMVSTCCGSVYVDEDADGIYWCDKCKFECDLVEDYEYEAQQRERWLEDRAEAKRKYNE